MDIAIFHQAHDDKNNMEIKMNTFSECAVVDQIKFVFGNNFTLDICLSNLYSRTQYYFFIIL